MRPKNPIPSVKLAQSGHDLGQSVKLGVWQQSIVKIMHIRKIGYSSVTVLSIFYLTDGIWNKIHPLNGSKVPERQNIFEMLQMI